MPTGALNYGVYRDAWLARVVSSNLGNGSGNRLQLGGAVISSQQWQNRVAQTFYMEDADFPAGMLSSDVTSVVVRWTIKGTSSCMAKGSAPKFVIRRTLDENALVIENAETGECAVVSNNHDYGATQTGGALETITTDEVIYEGTPSVDAVIEVDITELWKAWWDAKAPTDTHFTIVMISCDADGTLNETTASRRLAFYSSEHSAKIADGGKSSEIEIAWDIGSPPNTPTLSAPASGARLKLTANTFSATYSHPDGVDHDFSQLRIAGSNAVDGDGMLITDVRSTVIGGSAVMDGPPVGGVVSKSYDLGTQPSPALTRGNTYYWQVQHQDMNTEKSAWSSVRSFVVNRLPVPTKVKP